MTAKIQKPSDAGMLYGFDNRKDPNQRDFLATAMVGDKAQGKTSLMMIYAEMYLEEMNLLYQQGKLEKPRRVLIWDSVDAGVFHRYEEITVEELKYGSLIPGSDPPQARYWKNGIRRIVRRWRDKREDEAALVAITDYFRNGLLIADEVHDWMKAENPPAWQTDMILKHRNYGNDVVLGTQNLMHLPHILRPHFWRWVMFKTPETPNGPRWFEQRGFPQPKEMWETWKKVAMMHPVPTEKIQPFVTYEKTHEAMTFND